MPDAAPVWRIWHRGAFYFSTDPRLRKGVHLAATNTIVVHLESGDDVVIVEGLVERLAAETSIDDLDAIYFQKYGFHLQAGSTYRVQATKTFAWAEADFPSSATRWRFLLKGNTSECMIAHAYGNAVLMRCIELCAQFARTHSQLMTSVSLPRIGPIRHLLFLGHVDRSRWASVCSKPIAFTWKLKKTRWSAWKVREMGAAGPRHRVPRSVWSPRGCSSARFVSTIPADGDLLRIRRSCSSQVSLEASSLVH